MIQERQRQRHDVFHDLVSAVLLCHIPRNLFLVTLFGVGGNYTGVTPRRLESMEAILGPARFLPETLPHCKGEHLMVLFSLSKENLSGGATQKPHVPLGQWKRALISQRNT